MDERLTVEEQRVVKTARDFAHDVVAPGAAGWEAERAVPRDALAQAGAAGLAGLLVPTDLGGVALSIPARARVYEELASACMSFTFSLFAQNGVAGSVANKGTSEQIGQYLEDLLKVRKFGASLLTEARGGSDLAAIETRAERAGDGWLINGSKAWVSNGTVADIITVYVQTDPNAGWRGIACFLVDASLPGVIREPAYRLMGSHGIGIAGFRFEDCRVDATAQMTSPQDGFKSVMAGVDAGRVEVAAMCCGMLRNGLDCALDHTSRRSAFGHRLSELQGLQWMLADAATDLEAARLLTYHAAMLLDTGVEATMAAAHAKKFASRAAFTRLADCMQAMGAAGTSADCPLARHLVNAKMAQYAEGTTEIQNLVISRRLWREREGAS